jgi:predicted enzyme related to lactoylglutathione lyase
MGRVVHFEIHADDSERAVAFYRNVFGWTFSQWGDNPYWMIETGPRDAPGIDGGLLPRRGEIDGTAVTAFVCTVDVDDLDAAMAAVQENGGSIALEKQPVPGVGWLAYGKDTEGNLFGMMQSDESAA